MDCLSFHEKIKNNFTLIDKLLFRLPADSAIYKTLFSVRTSYCVRSELQVHKKESSFNGKIMSCIRFFAWHVCFPFVELETFNRQAIVIIGDWRFDESLSKEVKIPLLQFKKKLIFPKWKYWTKSWQILILIIKLFFFKEIRFSKFLGVLPEIYVFWKYYQSVDMSGIKVLVAEDDIYSKNVAVLYKAKEMGVKRVKVEYVQIDTLLHNNVFCDYYFYPTSFHKLIRENSAWNKSLVYIPGGYLNTEYTEIRLSCKDDNSKNFVSYFTSHGNMFVYDDTFYIEQILKVMPAEYFLCIKVHPYDIQTKYDYLKNNARVRIFHFDSISNAELISQSRFCFSQFSVLSLTAKHSCNNSYFINYSWRESHVAQDYEFLNKFFDTIDSLVSLKSVFSGTYVPVSQEEFRKNVNITYPHTFRVFKEFVVSLCRK